MRYIKLFEDYYYDKLKALKDKSPFKEIDWLEFNKQEKLKTKIDKASIQEISVRARGTPRIALKLLKRVRDFAQVHGDHPGAVRRAADCLQPRWNYRYWPEG